MYVSMVSSLPNLCAVNCKIRHYSGFAGISEKNNFDSFQKANITFGGIKNIVSEYAVKRFKNLNEVEECFNSLMRELISDKTTVKSSYLSYIVRGFKKSGFRGLLENLRMPKSTPEIDKLVEMAKFKRVNLVKSDERPVLQIFNAGKHSLWGGASSTRDIRVMFSNAANIDSKKAIIEFTIDKKGNFKVYQQYCKNYAETAYYSSTGNKRFETICSGNSKPNTTYYNKNGSESLLGNWFHGGSPAEPIY